MKFRPLLAITCLGLGLMSAQASADPGDPDRRFGGDGIVMTPPGELVTGTDVLVQPNGRVIAAGSVYVSSPSASSQAILIRYLRNGKPDPSFGAGGSVRLAGTYGLPALDVRPDGKLIVAALSGTAPTTIAIARLDRQGRPDATFGTGGVVQTSVELADFPIDALDVATAPGNRIVVAGGAPSAQPYSTSAGMLVARFLKDGSPDSSFAGTGSTVIAQSEGTWADSTAVLPDGRIGVGGVIAGDPGLVKLRRSGVPDRRFSRDGVLAYDSLGGSFEDVGTFEDGGLVVAGEASFAAFLAKFDGRGRFDCEFAEGRPVYPFVNEDQSLSELSSVEVDAASRIYILGSQNVFTAFDPQQAVLRYRRDGKLSKRYGGTELSNALLLEGGYPDLEALALGPGGSAAVVGSVIEGSRTIDSSRLVVAKLRGS